MKKLLCDNKHLKGFIYRIYYNQRYRCRKRNHANPSYTFKELYNYLKKDKTFINLYNIYINNNRQVELCPSLNRIDNSKSYSFDNINIITWKENRELRLNEHRLFCKKLYSKN